MGRIVGIDLGTTNSLVAHPAEHGPRVIEAPGGDVLLPSAVAVDPLRGLVLGKAARDFARLDPNAAILSVKRHMGTERTFLLGGEELRPQDVSAMILKDLRRFAESTLLVPVDRVVISVPAYFNEVQRRATREAGEIAGLRVERLISEPTAAALAYGLDRLDEESLVLVYDLGGGTFDVSILELFEGIFSVRAVSGDSRLGGDDFEERIFEWVVRSAEKRLGDRRLSPEAMPVCRLAVEAAKVGLSTEPSATLRLEDVPCTNGSVVNLTIEVRRELFESITRNLLERTGECVATALAEARVTKEKIDEVILVGGATRMPMVTRYLTELFGKPPNTSVNPMEAVARGAAIQAGLLDADPDMESIVVTDVSPFTLGVAVLGEHDGQLRPGVFEPLIHRNTSLPATRSESFATSCPEQDTVSIEIYQGDDPLVENNLLLDRYHLGGIPKNSERPEDLEISFSYDLDGILHVSALISSTGKSAGIRIDPTRMKAVGGGYLAASAKVSALWDRSLSRRVLEEITVTIEKLLAQAAGDTEGTSRLRGKLESARRALEQGNREEIERWIVELRGALPGRRDHES